MGIMSEVIATGTSVHRSRAYFNRNKEAEHEFKVVLRDGVPWIEGTITWYPRNCPSDPITHEYAAPYAEVVERFCFLIADGAKTSIREIFAPWK